MPIKIREQSVDVDIRAELERFTWTRPRWTADKLIAASPFRYDHTPSFFVNLEQGGWADSGAYDAEWASGNIIKLLAFLRNETYEETEDYLLAEYCRFYDNNEISLKVPTLKLSQKRKYLMFDILDKFSENYAYLSQRGISEEVQRQARVKYDAGSRAVVIPWFDANGRLCNVKYRTTYGKTFWYERGAIPVRVLVYGIETIREPAAVLCEAEIDALSWRQAGVQAVAVGGASFTDKQADIIKESRINIFYLSGDNDKAGRKFNEQVAAKLRGHVELRRIVWPDGVKDANEALVKGMDLCQILVEKSENVDFLLRNTKMFAV
jgi:DNA primase